MQRFRSTSIAVVSLAVCAVAHLCGSTPAYGVNVRVTVENLVPADSFFFTPVWIGFHDGVFDVYTSGQSAAGFPGLEEIAEEGNTGPLSTDFNTNFNGVDATITSPGGFVPAPVFDPGETSQFQLNVANSATHRFFSYASMVIPSNDAFFANGGPQDHMIFDAAGVFQGPTVIEIFGRDVLDAGTEVNDENGGAAFSANGGTSADQGGLIASHSGLSNFVGTQTAAGTTISTDLADDTLIARITIVPEPTALTLSALAMFLFGALARPGTGSKTIGRGALAR